MCWERTQILVLVLWTQDCVVFTHFCVYWINTNLCRICIKYVSSYLFLYTLIYFYIHLFIHERIYILQFNHNMHNCLSNYKYYNSVIVRRVSDSSVDRTLACAAWGREFALAGGKEFFGVLEHVSHKTCVVIFNTSTCVKSTQTCVFHIWQKCCVLENTN